MSSSSTLTLRNVPFLHWDEWIQVKTGIYSKNHELKMEALRRISIWRSRGNLPHSVDLTGQIVEVQNQDPVYFAEAATKHTFPDKNSQADNLRLLYSVIVVRSVNGIVEPSQQSFFAQSILSIAERLGLPGWIVELRHDATHKQLPSLSVLRAAGDYLLNWYLQNYWDPQMNFLQSLTQSCIPIKLIVEKDQFTPEAQGQWLQALVKNMNSSTFTTDIFFPFFISAVIKVSLSSWYYSTDKDIQYCFQKLMNQQYSTWMPIFQRIIEFKDNWLDAFYCRMIHAFIELINDFPNLNSEERIILEHRYQIKLVLAWFTNLRKLEIVSTSSPSSSSITFSLNIPNQKQLKPKKKKRRSLQKNASNTSLTSLASASSIGMTSTIPTIILLRWKRREFLRSMKYQLDYTLSSFQKNQLDIFNLLSNEIEFFSRLVEFSLNDSNPFDSNADEKNEERDIERKKFLEEISNYLQPPKKLKTKTEVSSEDEAEPTQDQDYQNDDPPSNSPKKRSLEEAIENAAEEDDSQEEGNEEEEGVNNERRPMQQQSGQSEPNYPPENSFQHYMEHGNAEQRIYQCHDFPLWSLGLMPGKFDCSELFSIREIS